MSTAVRHRSEPRAQQRLGAADPGQHLPPPARVIHDSLVNHGPATVLHMAERVHLDPMAVHAYLLALADAGLACRREEGVPLSAGHRFVWKAITE